MPRPPRTLSLLGFCFLATALVSGTAVANAAVHVDLVDQGDDGMKIATSADTVGAGKVTFEVTNDSKDNEHEFIIARLKTAPGKVPYDDTNGRVKESALGGVTELGDLEPGKSGTMTMDLTPGSYLLFCNLPGHYKAGMYHVLTVTQ